jgi:hypothetical protein
MKRGKLVMTRLLICTATIIALTASANAQNSYFGPNGGPNPYSGNQPIIRGYTCAHTIAKGACIDAPKPAQVQRSKKKGQ